MNSSLWIITKKLRGFLLSIIGLVSLFSFIALVSCTEVKKQDEYSKTPVNQTAYSQTPSVLPGVIETLNIVQTTPSQIYLKPTQTLDPIYYFGDEISFTQEPVIISTLVTTIDSAYLYKDTIVTLKLVNPVNAYAYINLDDLLANTPELSDIEINRTIGTDAYYRILPINNAFFFLIDGETASYETCALHFPIQGGNNSSYLVQGEYFIDGYSYCVLTNEGRIAIVSYIDDSKKYIDGMSEELSILVIVFNKSIE